MNVVLIVSDTLRRDHLGLYGNKTIRTPHLDRFAQQCVIFDKCYANSFPTMPMRADIFTGKWTYTYLGWAPLPQEEVVLAEVLQKAGYLTKAVVDTPFFVRGDYNYDRGFQDFECIQGQDYGERQDRSLQRRYETDHCAPATMLAASQWLERHYKEKFFLYVDTWDPHEPWDAPQWYTELYYPSYDGNISYPNYGGYPHYHGKIIRPCYWTWKDAEEAIGRRVTEEDLKLAHACYRGEVTMVDRWVGYLLDTMESMNLMNETIVIFTSDHGFYFGEHGIFGKGMWREGKWHRSPLYEEIARVPLLIHVPGVKAQRVNTLVSLADLMPTTLELVEVEIPDTVQAQSMVPALKGELTEREFVVTSSPLYNPGEITRLVDARERKVAEPLPSSITTSEWTLLYASEGQPAELYHLPSDPKQEKNVILDEPQVAHYLLNKFVSRLEKTGTEPRLLNPRRHF